MALRAWAQAEPALVGAAVVEGPRAAGAPGTDVEVLLVVEDADEPGIDLGWMTVHHHRYVGGHAFPPWREELAPALCWLRGGAPAPA